MESNAVANIAQNIKDGVPPSNKDVEKIIDKTQAVVEKKGYKGANPEVIENLVAVLEDTRLFLKDKNGDEKIQKFIIHTKEFAKDMQPRVDIPDAEKERAQKIAQRAKDAATNLQQAAIQLVTSPDFRDLIYDFTDILREAGMQELNKNDTGAVEKGKQIQDVNNVQEAKQVATETKDKAVAMAKNVASDVKSGNMKVDEGTKQELSARWNAILKRAGDNESMKKATSAMFALYDELRAGYYDMQAEAQKTKEELTYDANLKKLRGEGYDIIAEFTGKDNLDKFVDQFWTLMYQIKNDKELNQYFDDMRAYIMEAINNPQSLDKEDAKKKGDEMMQRGRKLWSKFQGRDDADKLLRQGQQLIKGIKTDPVVAKMKEDTEALAKSTFLDAQGRPSLQLTKETLGNLKGVIVPAILDNLTHIPIGRIEGVTDAYEFVFDDLSFSGKDLLPDHVYVKLDADVDFDLKHLSSNDTPQYILRVEFRGMDAIFNDTKFWFKKTTFPHMEDHGVADVQIKGVTIVMKWYSPREGPNANKFTLQKVRTHIYSADVKFKEAKHDILLPMATKMYAGSVRHKLERLIERNLGERLSFVSDKLNQVTDIAASQMQKQYEKVVEKTIEPLISSK